jgi:hypothetical protein
MRDGFRQPGRSLCRLRSLVLLHALCTCTMHAHNHNSLAFRLSHPKRVTTTEPTAYIKPHQLGGPWGEGGTRRGDRLGFGASSPARDSEIQRGLLLFEKRNEQERELAGLCCCCWCLRFCALAFAFVCDMRRVHWPAYYYYYLHDWMECCPLSRHGTSSNSFF